MRDGKALQFKNIEAAIHNYTSGFNIDSSLQASFNSSNNEPCITKVKICEEKLKIGSIIVEIDFTSPFLFTPVPGILIHGEDRGPVCGSNTRMHRSENIKDHVKKGTLRCELIDTPLHEGVYSISVWLGDWYKDYDSRPFALQFNFFPKAATPNKPAYDFLGPLDIVGSWSSIK